MTIYEALAKLIERLVPGVKGRVYHIMGTYEEAIAHIEKKQPFATFEFKKLDEKVDMSGGTGIYDIRVEIDAFASTVEAMAKLAKEIKLNLVGRHEQDGFDFVLIPDGSQDVAEIEGVHRHVMYWKGNVSE